MQTTTNYGLKEYEGTDLFNPLTVENVNTASLDTIIKAVSDSAVGTAVEYLTANVHTLTRDDSDRPVFHFVATSNYTAGDVFVVDGQQVTAHTPDGQSLSTGAFIIGAGVLCVLDGTLLTLIVNPAKALDADNLDGHDSTYYATAAGLASTNNNVDTLSNKIGTGVPSTQAQTVIGAINEINNSLTRTRVAYNSVANLTVQLYKTGHVYELSVNGISNSSIPVSGEFPILNGTFEVPADPYIVTMVNDYTNNLLTIHIENNVISIQPRMAAIAPNEIVRFNILYTA